MAALTFLEAFNAKEMRLSDVVESFVPSSQFHQLAGNWHSLLIGPRGSGKTTYLRMLELKALRKWGHPDAAKYRRAITYAGIYVPADIAWGAMVEALGGGRLKPECLEAVAATAFCTNVLQAAVTAMEARYNHTPDSVAPDYLYTNLSSAHAEKAIREIAEGWQLEIRTVSFGGLQTALGRRMLDLQSKALQIAADPNHSLRDIYTQIKYSTLQFDQALNFALTELDKQAGHTEGKWALLLDEFEIAPPQLQKLVLASLRSASKKLLYKVALAPCGPHTQDSLSTLAPPSEGNDYRQVELWHQDKQSALSFCEKLFAARVNDYKPLQGKSPTDVLGHSLHGDFEDDATDKTDKNEWAKRWEKEFIELQEKDPSFRRFLADKNIDPFNLDASLSTNRKIAPIVAFRNAHRRSIGSAQRKGRKKLFFAYTGWKAIAAITEGNPRWFIGVFNMIASRISSSSQLPVPQSIQHDQVKAASETFTAMLQTAATEQAMGISTKHSVYKLLSDIGNYFNSRIVEGDFIEEIPLSFEVDTRVDEDTENALRIAFNLGAIVSLSRSDQLGGYKSLKSKRFRLAYLLAPEFRLPLRATKSIALSSILMSGAKGLRSPQTKKQTADSARLYIQGKLL